MYTPALCLRYLFMTMLMSIAFSFISVAQTSASDCPAVRSARLNYPTDLIRKGPAPQGHQPFETVRETIKEVFYKAQPGMMRGLLDTTNIKPGKQGKVLVYLHGGFALGYQDVSDCQPFTDAGFTVFAPAYRGENGNPGHYEMMFGEVQDAMAAIDWVNQQDFTHPDSIYVFGHSIGGAISLSLSLFDALPINLAASAAGIYTDDSFGYWAEADPEKVPFSMENEIEIAMRLPILMLPCMTRPHIMYMGTEDDYQAYRDWVIDGLYEDVQIDLEFVEIEGNHFTSLKPSMKAFMERIEQQE